jgi:hypothetical protein
MRNCALKPALVLVLLLCGLMAWAQERAGTIEFSDGTTLAGNLSLTPGSQLKLQAGPEVRVFGFDRVREMRFAPEKEATERAWRFPEAGQTAKEYFGDPYPVRYLKATVTLADGEELSGHLYTTVIYVASEGGAQKVILPAKQQGKEGETFRELIYPARICFGDSATATAGAVKLKLRGLGAAPEVVAITRGGLVRLEAKPLAAGECELPSPLGQAVFLAAKSGRKITVGWPKTADHKTFALASAALTNSEDFFDDRRILGAVEDATNSEIYSLVLAMRRGKTALAEIRSRPWRLEIYRWKLGDDGRVMLAGRNYFFRGIGAKGEAPPAVELSENLWQIRQEGKVWTTGDE